MRHATPKNRKGSLVTRDAMPACRWMSARPMIEMSAVVLEQDQPEVGEPRQGDVRISCGNTTSRIVWRLERPTA